MQHRAVWSLVSDIIKGLCSPLSCSALALFCKSFFFFFPRWQTDNAFWNHIVETNISSVLKKTTILFSYAFGMFRRPRSRIMSWQQLSFADEQAGRTCCGPGCLDLVKKKNLGIVSQGLSASVICARLTPAATRVSLYTVSKYGKKKLPNDVARVWNDVVVCVKVSELESLCVCVCVQCNLSSCGIQISSLVWVMKCSVIFL